MQKTEVPSGAVEIEPGQWGLAIMPYSEVCVHMQVAGKPMLFILRADGMMVQLFSPSGQVFSGPITPGEAGIYQDGQRRYYYPLSAPWNRPLPVSQAYQTKEGQEALEYFLKNYEKVPPGVLDARD